MDRPFGGAGRPPKNPLRKVGRPVRALVTPPVVNALETVMEQSNITISDALRLALFGLLKRRGLVDDDLYNDPTWSSLKQKGLV